MTIANVRVGVWLRNPRDIARLADAPSDDRRVRLHRGGAQPGYLPKELLGRNSIDDRYVYVKDESYYESLGLVGARAPRLHRDLLL